MKPSIRAIIIDDEPLARKRVSNLLLDVEEIKIIDECISGQDAITSISKNKPDLIFLDIQMKDMTGFDVLKNINPENRPLVIFITAYDEFALKAFDFFAFDYLMKPFKDERFLLSTKKAIDLFYSKETYGLNNKINQLINYIESPEKKFNVFTHNKLAIKAKGKIIFIDKIEIKYILASGYYAEIYTQEKKYLLRESLTSLMDQLDPLLYFRVHRSTIINISFIKEVVYSNYGEIDVKMMDEKLFRISKTHKKEFQSKIGIK